MSCKYYLAADGGGSKLQAILYDENFKIVRACRSNGTNILFKDKNAVMQSICNLIDDILGNDVSVIESVDICILASADFFCETLAKRCEIRNLRLLGEETIALAAAWKQNGAVALSGTGSFGFVRLEDGVKRTPVGGWGPLLSDDGSGYDIGLRSIKAAIRSADGRCPPTVMHDMIMEKWKLTKLIDVISFLNGNLESRHEIASVSMITSRAAAMGDQVAIDIYKYAAHEMAVQVLTAIKNAGVELTFPIVTAGGAWKGSSHMFQEFCREVRETYPNAEILLPEFEPVVGCVISRCFSEGAVDEQTKAAIYHGFQKFLYPR